MGMEHAETAVYYIDVDQMRRVLTTIWNPRRHIDGRTASLRALHHGG